jgi:hypothetical protein
VDLLAWLALVSAFCSAALMDSISLFKINIDYIRN